MDIRHILNGNLLQLFCLVLLGSLYLWVFVLLV
jgi:hypothetical protein